VKEMDNKKRKTNCLNCSHSFRDRGGVLRCEKGNMTSVTNYDCNDYEVFIEDKEDLVTLYKTLNLQKVKRK